MDPSAERLPGSATDANRNRAMTTTERVAALLSVHQQLQELMTADELAAYPALDHLGDLIEDLQLEIE